MELLRQYLPFLIPLILLEYALAIAALVHMLRHRKFRFGSLPIWIVAVMVIQIIGPVLYFVLGRGEEE